MFGLGRLLSDDWSGSIAGGTAPTRATRKAQRRSVKQIRATCYSSSRFQW